MVLLSSNPPTGKFPRSVLTYDRDIWKLDPLIIPNVVRLLAHDVVFGNRIWKPFVVEANRSCERQNYLYQLGRTIKDNDGVPVKKVTDAKCNESEHQFGKAIDIAFHDENGSISYDLALYRVFYGIVKPDGWSWGGNWWFFKDYAHFYIPNPKPMQIQLARRKNSNGRGFYIEAASPEELIYLSSLFGKPIPFKGKEPIWHDVERMVEVEIDHV